MILSSLIVALFVLQQATFLVALWMVTRKDPKPERLEVREVQFQQPQQKVVNFEETVKRQMDEEAEIVKQLEDEWIRNHGGGA